MDEQKRDVVKALRQCALDNPRTCKGCPYNWMKSAECITTLMCDALELLEKDGEE